MVDHDDPDLAIVANNSALLYALCPLWVAMSKIDMCNMVVCVCVCMYYICTVGASFTK